MGATAPEGLPFRADVSPADDRVESLVARDAWFDVHLVIVDYIHNKCDLLPACLLRVALAQHILEQHSLKGKLRL